MDSRSSEPGLAKLIGVPHRSALAYAPPRSRRGWPSEVPCSSSTPEIPCSSSTREISCSSTRPTSLVAGARPPPRPLLTARLRLPELGRAYPRPGPSSLLVLARRSSSRHVGRAMPVPVLLTGATLLLCSRSDLCGAISVRAPISATPSPSTAPLLL